MLKLTAILNIIGDSSEIANRLGVTIEDVEYWFKGIKYPNAVLIRKIAKLVDMSDRDVWRAIYHDAMH